ncbi:hypothetical protein DPMN_034269, partial [Dreissena polymorpha]
MDWNGSIPAYSTRSSSDTDNHDIRLDLSLREGTLYIPKSDGGRTLIRRRKGSTRTLSSKKRSSSRRKRELDQLEDGQDNHLLPSLRFLKRNKRKTLRDRKFDLYEEQCQNQEVSTALARQTSLGGEQADGYVTPKPPSRSLSTLKRMSKLGEWSKPKKRELLKRRSREFFSNFAVWLTSFKVIEGKYGTAVMSFFRFIRWLMFLNIFLTLICLCVILFPFLAQGSRSFKDTAGLWNPTATNGTDYQGLAHNCSAEYEVYTKDNFNRESTFQKVLDVLQGTGWMERTVLFYGYYHNSSLPQDDGDVYVYNMGLAYLLTFGSSFLVCLLLIVRSSAHSVKATFGRESAVAAYTNRVFAGWDYAITNKTAAKIKQANLYFEYKSCLDEEIQNRRRENRDANDTATITFIRILVNCFVVVLLGASFFLVYFTTDKLLELQERDLSEIVLLIVQYLPYLTITVLNFAIPIAFQKLVFLEDYSPNFALRLTLFRSILLRLASLVVLIISLYRLLITNTKEVSGSCGNKLWNKTSRDEKGSIKCWETYVGQQIYKLVLLDLIVETCIIIFVQYPRRLIYNHFHGRFSLVKKTGPNEFDLPQNVIDIIYTQTLCWLGMFFSPLIPLMTLIKCFCFFYLRKWTLLKNCAQTEKTYRTSRSHSLFMFVLLVSFVFAFAPIGYMISSMKPSQSCGPFRVYSSENYTMFDSVSDTVVEWPWTINRIFFFLGSSGFFIPAIILLILLIYYFWLLGRGFKHREKILSDQLKL